MRKSELKIDWFSCTKIRGAQGIGNCSSVELKKKKAIMHVVWHDEATGESNLIASCGVLQKITKHSKHLPTLQMDHGDW